MIQELIKATEEGNIELVQNLIQTPGIDINSTGGMPYNALERASMGGHYEIVRLLLEAGADPNTLNYQNQTPFMYAAVHSNIQIMDLLLEHGADVNLCSLNLMRLVGQSSQITEQELDMESIEGLSQLIKNYSVLDRIKDLQLVNTQTLSSFRNSAKLEKMSYLLGAAQDERNLSLNEDDCKKLIYDRIDYGFVGLRSKTCALSEIAASLISVNLLTKFHLNETEQNKLNIILENLLSMIQEYNLNPDSLKNDLERETKYLVKNQQGLTYLELIREQATDSNKLLATIQNLYHIDHLIKAKTKYQEILQTHDQLSKQDPYLNLSQALNTFMPLVKDTLEPIETIAEITDIFLPHIGNDFQQILESRKTIALIENSPLRKVFLQTYNLKTHHPYLSKIVDKIHDFNQSESYKLIKSESIQRYIEIKGIRFQSLLENPEFKKEIEEKKELNKVVKLLPELKSLRLDTFRELCELIGASETVERFGNAKFICISDSSTQGQQEEGGRGIDQMHLSGELVHVDIL